MAEVVGVVVGVVSLGVQLAESLQKVKRFYDTVRDAPERLADTIDEIGSLSAILTELEKDSATNGADDVPSMQRCVVTCRNAVDRFSTYAESLESRIKRCRGRGSIKFAMKSESIESVIVGLESSKSNLVLAYMLYREAIADKRARLVQDQLEMLAGGQALTLQRRGTMQDTRPIVSKHLEQPSHFQSDTRPWPVLRTPTWLSHVVWEIAMSQAISGWTFSIRSYSLICFTSPVAAACRSGDIAHIQHAFDRREASPFDLVAFPNDTWTVSLLYAAVMRNNVEVSRLLVRHGATSLHAGALIGSIWSSPSTKLTKEIFDDKRDWFRFLIEHSEVNWMYEYAFPWVPDRAAATHKADLHAFVYGSTEESMAAFFWIKLANERSKQLSLFDLHSVALSHDMSHLLKYGATDSTTRMNYLALAYVASATRSDGHSASNKRMLGSLVAGAIDQGLDVHGSADGISPLLLILHQRRLMSSARDMGARLSAWLDLLKSIGVSLHHYGKEEWRRFQALRRNCEQPWDWWHGIDAHQCEGRRFDHLDNISTLMAFTYGADVSDWKLYIHHPGDHYAGHFWRLIERNGIYSRHVPGGWVEAE